MLRRSLLLAWLVAILGVLAPSIASAATTANLETRVKGFELVGPTRVGRSNARTPEKHREKSNAYDAIASGSPLAAEAGGGANIVYRGLAAGEDAAGGLVARVPNAGNSVASHVAGARASQGISTTRSLDVATGRFGANGVVRIDLSKVGNPFVDLSRWHSWHWPGHELSRWAINAQEVLIQGSVPAEQSRR